MCLVFYNLFPEKLSTCIRWFQSLSIDTCDEKLKIKNRLNIAVLVKMFKFSLFWERIVNLILTKWCILESTIIT